MRSRSWSTERFPRCAAECERGGQTRDGEVSGVPLFKRRCICPCIFGEAADIVPKAHIHRSELAVEEKAVAPVAGDPKSS